MEGKKRGGWDRETNPAIYPCIAGQLKSYSDAYVHNFGSKI